METKAFVNGQQKDFSTMKKIGSRTVDGNTFTLYASKKNKYYIHCTGEFDDATDMDFQSAKKWAKENLTPADYTAEFENNNPKNYSFNCNVSGWTAEFLEQMRGNTGKSYGDILTESIKYMIENEPALNHNLKNRKEE